MSSQGDTQAGMAVCEVVILQNFQFQKPEADEAEVPSA
jgi:hypothetical protein